IPGRNGNSEESPHGRSCRQAGRRHTDVGTEDPGTGRFTRRARRGETKGVVGSVSLEGGRRGRRSKDRVRPGVPRTPSRRGSIAASDGHGEGELSWHTGGRHGVRQFL